MTSLMTSISNLSDIDWADLVADRLVPYDPQRPETIFLSRDIAHSLRHWFKRGQDEAAVRVEMLKKALTAAKTLLEEEHKSLTEGYTILYTKDPHCGELSAEGKEIIAPFNDALALAHAALQEERK